MIMEVGMIQGGIFGGFGRDWLRIRDGRFGRW